MICWVNVEKMCFSSCKEIVTKTLKSMQPGLIGSKDYLYHSEIQSSPGRTYKSHQRDHIKPRSDSCRRSCTAGRSVPSDMLQKRWENPNARRELMTFLNIHQTKGCVLCLSQSHTNTTLSTLTFVWAKAH